MFANHPAADLFPMLSEQELADLAADIRENGLLEPIVLHEAMVLDGRNRLAACERAGVDARFVTWDGRGGSPLRYVLSHNLHRRHLTIAQRAALAVEIIPLFEEEARKRQLGGLMKGDTPDLPNSAKRDEPIHARDEAAEMMGVGSSTVARAKEVKNANPEIFEHLKAGEYRSVESAHRAAGLAGSDSGRSKTHKTTSTRLPTEREIAAFTRAMATVVQSCLSLRDMDVPENLPAEVRERAAGDLREAVTAAKSFRRRLTMEP